jgi:uncharacterized protein (DUF342 family)
VVIVSGHGIILGGRTTATNKISAASIGNMYYVPTEIEVGVHSEFREKFLAKTEEVKVLHSKMDELERNIVQAEQGSSGRVDTSLLNTFKNQREECSRQMQKLKTELSEIEKVYYSIGDPVVIVTRKVFPETVIKIKHAVFEVTEELSHVMFKLTDDGIQYLPI